MRKILGYIKSLNLSLFLMVAIIPIIALGNIIPQQGKVSPQAIAIWQKSYPAFAGFAAAVGLDHIYTTWLFIILTSLLFLNMTLVTWDLIWVVRRRARGLHRYGEEGASLFLLGSLPMGQNLLSSLKTALDRRGYHVREESDGIYARKGWIGIWGGAILHVGLVVIIIGGMVSGLTRFNGYFELGEGQAVPDQPESYQQVSVGPLFHGNHPEVTIGVEKITASRSGKMKLLSSLVRLSEGGRAAAVKTIKMNDYVVYRGMKVYQTNASGPAILLSLAGPQGESAGFVNVEEREEQEEVPFSIPGTILQAKADLRQGPDAIGLSVFQGPRVLFRGILRNGESRDVAGHMLTFHGVKRWTGLSVVYDRAVPIVFTGFFLLITGIGIMGLCDPRELWARTVTGPDGSRRIEIAGWGRWGNMFREEYADIMENVTCRD